MIPVKWAFAYEALGPISYFGRNVDYYVFVVHMQGMLCMILSFLLSFGYR